MTTQWVDWDGGDCPIPADTAFRVKLRNGMECRGKPNEEWRWGRADHDGDIVAYQIIGDRQ